MRCFVEVDLMQAEWVVTAFCSQDPRMLKVVYEKLDPHITTGEMISKAPKDFVKLENSLVGHATDPGEIAKKREALPKEWNGVPIEEFFLPRNMSIRQSGKKSNHALNYKMGYGRFALENGMQESDAKRIVDAYRDRAYPGLKDYYRAIERELRQNNRRLVNCFGQTIRLLDRWGPDLLDSAYAFKPQSTVGNITGWGWRAIHDDTVNLKNVEPVAQVHDSVCTQNTFSDLEELRDQIELQAEYMATPFCYHGREYTLRREVKIGLSWGESSMKEVPVSDEGGVDLDDLERTWEEALAAA